MISKDLRKYLISQKRDIIRAFNDPASYPIAVISPEESSRNILNCRWDWDPHVRKEKSAFIREIDGRKEYWIAVSEKRLYRTWFKKFIEREFNVAFNSIPSTLHADHLFSKAVAEEAGIKYVRMAFVWQRYNTVAGWATEKGFKDYVENEIGKKGKYLFDYSIIFKPIGIVPPKSKKELNLNILDYARKISNRTGGNSQLVLDGLRMFFDDTWWPIFPDQAKIRKAEFRNNR
ncbi:hypothetical protein ACT8ZR_29020 [Neobacillus sp. M.A.Huq-85]